MSEGEGGAQAPATRGVIRSPKDFWGGIALMLLALFAIWASSDLPGMRGFAFGPGTAPRMFAYVLMALGAAISLVGVLTDGEPLEQFTFAGPIGASLLLLVLIPLNIFSSRISHLLPSIAPDVVLAFATGIVVVLLAFVLMRIAPRGPLMITAATIVFGVTVRPLGLVIASFISLVVSAYATEEIRWIETLIWCAILTAFCAVLFPYGLNLPLQLWPRL
jgi:putative tricarboxylic transport membrane protein